MLLIAFLILGLLAGVLSGLFGIGGGIIMVPALIIIFNKTILQANAISLAAMLLPVGILGVIKYYQAGFIDVKKALIISLGLTIGSGFGAELALYINKNLLEKLYAAFLIYNVVSYLGFDRIKKQTKEKKHLIKHSFYNFLIIGFLAGIIAGMFGKGGGIIIVPFLINFFNFDTRQATATSLAALQLPVGLPGVYLYAVNGQLEYIPAILIALGIVIGTYFGTHLALNVSSDKFKKIYALFLLFTALSLIFK